MLTLLPLNSAEAAASTLPRASVPKSRATDTLLVAAIRALISIGWAASPPRRSSLSTAAFRYGSSACPANARLTPASIWAQGSGQLSTGPSMKPAALSRSTSCRNCRSPTSANGPAHAAPAAQSASSATPRMAVCTRFRYPLPRGKALGIMRVPLSCLGGNRYSLRTTTGSKSARRTCLDGLTGGRPRNRQGFDDGKRATFRPSGPHAGPQQRRQHALRRLPGPSFRWQSRG